MSTIKLTRNEICKSVQPKMKLMSNEVNTVAWYREGHPAPYKWNKSMVGQGCLGNG